MASLETEASQDTALARALGHAFRQPQLLQRALTHRSAGAAHNERLEFLGDALLGFVTATFLYRDHPQADEGELTRRRAALVKRETLARIARSIDLGRYLRLGEGEMKSGGWRRDSILANAMEAVLGAVYLDAGIDACSALLRRLIETQLVDIDAGGVAKDAKTRLQELLQGQGLALPIYETLRMEGEPHAQAFTVRCRVEDRGGAGTEATGTGPSRRRAEQEAAKAVLAWLEHDAN